jgi:hypothetical protein
MDPLIVSSVSLRTALKHLAEITCGTAPAVIEVAVSRCGEERTYAALVPFEYRAEVHHYLARHTNIAMPLDGGALILAGDQALEVISLAYRVRREGAAAVLELQPPPIE